jgi:hypothetical protein
MTTTETATETAHKAIAIARKLSPTMQAAITSAPNFEEVRWAHGGTVKALVSRRIADPAADWYGPAAFTLTGLGRAVHAVLIDGADAVLDHAKRTETREATERARTAEAERRGFSAEEDRMFCADCAVVIRAHGTENREAEHPDAEACGKRQDECEGMPTLPFTDWGNAGRTWTAWVAHVRQVRTEATEGRELAADLLAHDFTELHLGERIDIGERDAPLVTAFRETVMDELYARAHTEHAERSRPGPHFCNPACWDSHATAWDRAGAAAEVCSDPRHFERYPDTTPELIRAHVSAHLNP